MGFLPKGEGKVRVQRTTRVNVPIAQAVKCGMSFRQRGHCILLESLFNSQFCNSLHSSIIFSSFCHFHSLHFTKHLHSLPILIVLRHFNFWHFWKQDNEFNSTNKSGCEDNFLVSTQVYWFPFPRQINYKLIEMSEKVWSSFLADILGICHCFSIFKPL